MKKAEDVIVAFAKVIKKMSKNDVKTLKLYNALEFLKSVVCDIKPDYK